MSNTAPGTHAILEHVILGCGAMFDAKRVPMAARLTVHPSTEGMAADPNGLLAALDDAWPAEAGPMSLNLTSEAWMVALMDVKTPAHLMVEVPAFLAGEDAWGQRVRQRSSEGLAMVLKGRPLQPLPPDLLNCFKYAIVDRADDRYQSAQPTGGAVRTLPFVQSGNANPAEAGDSFKRGAKATLGWPLGDAPDGSKPKKGVPGSVAVVMDLIQRVDREEPAAKLEAVTVVAATCSQSWIAPNLAWSFVAVTDADLIEPMFTEIHMWRVRDADFEIDGQRYGVFAHDWRVEPAHEWLRLKAERASRIR